MREVVLDFVLICGASRDAKPGFFMLGRCLDGMRYERIDTALWEHFGY